MAFLHSPEKTSVNGRKINETALTYPAFSVSERSALKGNSGPAGPSETVRNIKLALNKEPAFIQDRQIRIKNV